MARRRQKDRKAAPPAESAPKPAATDAARFPWLLVAVTALFVARPWTAGEMSVVTGDGLSFVVLTLLAALTWTGLSSRRSEIAVRFGWVDLLLVVFLVVQTIAAVRGGLENSPREGINALWEWIGLGVAFLLVRQAVHHMAHARAAVAAMLAVAVALSAYGIFQVTVTQPEARAAYYANPEAALLAAGTEAPPGSPQRWLFEQRLASTEPIATFALANSLAGLLTAWLVMHWAIAAFGWDGAAEVDADGIARRSDANARATEQRFMRGLLWLLSLVVLACLLMIKSRSAYIAVAFGVAALAVVERKRLRISWKAIVSAVAAVASIIGVLATLGMLDRQVLTEAFKSLSYRGQYWRGAVQMIADRPLLGVGPGQFQSYYLHYKSPTSSEEIADPHNFLLEIAATSGLLGLATFIAFLAAVALTIGRGRSESFDDGNSEQLQRGPLVAVSSAFAGVCVAWLIGRTVTVDVEAAAIVIGGAMLLLTLFTIAGWVARGALQVAWLTIASLALLLNLLAAGGISAPGVAGTLWLLMALATTIAAPSQRVIGRGWMFGLFLGVLALIAACYYTAYGPVMRARPHLERARQFELSTEEGRAARERELKQAVAADPWAVPGWTELAIVEFARWRASNFEHPLDDFDRYSAEAVARARHTSRGWLRAGTAEFAFYRETGDTQRLTRAVDFFRRAVELYPNSAITRAHLALALAPLDAEAAKEEARRALQLSDITPHFDQKLRPDLREMIESIALDAPQTPES